MSRVQWKVEFSLSIFTSNLNNVYVIVEVVESCTELGELAVLMDSFDLDGWLNIGVIHSVPSTIPYTRESHRYTQQLSFD